MADSISEYEKQRQAQIAKNKAMLESLNIHEITSKMAPVKSKPTKEKKRKLDDGDGSLSVRRSSRLAGDPPEKAVKLESNEVTKVEITKERKEGDITIESAATTATKDAHVSIYTTLKSISLEENVSSARGDSPTPKRSSLRLKGTKTSNNTNNNNNRKAKSTTQTDNNKENNDPQHAGRANTPVKVPKKYATLTKDDIDYDKLQVAAVTKTVPERIYTVALHPTVQRIVCATGDKWGRIGLWDYGTLDEPTAENDLCIYAPHNAPVSGLLFCPSDCSKLFSCSYDGSLRCADIEQGKFLELYYDGVCRSCLDVDPTSPYVLYSGTSEGDLTMLDTRSSKLTTYDVHKRKLHSVSVKPDNPHIIATASNDQSVCIWDLRKMNKPVHTFIHGQAVTSCAFSKQTGKFLVSLSYDNHVRIWQDFKETHKISHNCTTGRWITPFKVTWDPKSEAVFACGNMTRSLDVSLYVAYDHFDTNHIFDAKTAIKKAQLVDEDLTAIPSINAFHPHHNIVISATASGRTYLWK